MARENPRLFKFRSDEIESIENTDLFQDAVVLAVAYNFTGHPTWYRGDPMYLENLPADPLEWWNHLKQFSDMSLPYISPCLALPDESTSHMRYCDIDRDCSDREILITLANAGDRIAKYVYYHRCQAQAVFITAAVVKCLWGGEVLSRMYVRTNELHVVMTNFSPQGLSKDWDEPLYFDFIAQVMETEIDAGDAATLLGEVEDVEELGDVQETLYIPYPKAIEWFVKYFGFKGDEVLKREARRFGQRLLEQ